MTKQFGGPWTQTKLDVLEGYLKAYLTALSKQKFSLGYIDAFAGDGSIMLASSEEDKSTDIGGLIIGSAQRALALEPGFDGYVFIERDQKAVERLNSLQQEFPKKRIQVKKGDANQEVKEICRQHSWKTRRAVVFLDPTGMQVEWSTLEAIASTQAIDVWIWFPLGIGVNRLLTRTGKINPQWQDRLDKIFGIQEWREEFYKTRNEHTLFGIDKRTEKVATPNAIATFWIKRLQTIFPAVAPNPAIMRNSTNNPIYLLCFASANPGKGGHIALGIASHLLNNA